MGDFSQTDRENDLSSSKNFLWRPLGLLLGGRINLTGSSLSRAESFTGKASANAKSYVSVGRKEIARFLSRNIKTHDNVSGVSGKRKKLVTWPALDHPK